MSDYEVIYSYGLPELERRGRPRKERKQETHAEPVIKIDPRHETDAHGWPTEEAIRKATEQVKK